jgi:hypothetical protein
VGLEGSEYVEPIAPEGLLKILYHTFHRQGPIHLFEFLLHLLIIDLDHRLHFIYFFQHPIVLEVSCNQEEHESVRGGAGDVSYTIHVSISSFNGFLDSSLKILINMIHHTTQNDVIRKFLLIFLYILIQI